MIGTLRSHWLARTLARRERAVTTEPQTMTQTAFAEDGDRDLELLLICDGCRGVRCSPVHPRFGNTRGRAAYVDNHGMHCAARSSGEGARVDIKISLFEDQYVSIQAPVLSL